MSDGFDHSSSATTQVSSLPPAYALREGPPSVDDFLRLREAAGMSPRSREAAERGLPNTTFGVHVVYRPDEREDSHDGETDTSDDGAKHSSPEVVGMARIVGDAGSVFHVADMAVAEAHQGRGVGTAIMDTLVAWLRAEAPAGSTINLLADVDGFYERWGFEESAPASKGMWLRHENL